MSGLEPLIVLASTALGAAGQVMSSNAESAAAEANAKQLEARSTADLADSTIKADQDRKQADRLISKQRAIAAASGGGTGGSAATIIADTAGQSQYRSDMDIWLGENRSASDKYAADVQRMEDRAKRRALPFAVGASVLSGVSRAAYGRSALDRKSADASDYAYG